MRSDGSAAAWSGIAPVAAIDPKSVRLVMRIRPSSYSLQDYPSVVRRVVNAIGSIHRVGLHHWHRLWEIGRMIVFRPFRRFGISLTLCLLVLAHPSRAS